MFCRFSVNRAKNFVRFISVENGLFTFKVDRQTYTMRTGKWFSSVFILAETSISMPHFKNQEIIRLPFSDWKFQYIMIKVFSLLDITAWQENHTCSGFHHIISPL